MTRHHIVVLGDVGGVGGYHVGDEAMLESALAELSSRGITRSTVLSGDPVDTSARYDTESIPLFGFAALGSEAERAQRLAHILADPREPHGFGQGDPARRIRDSLSGTSAVVITGGGNLDATWPHHVYERAALVGMAAALGVPVVTTGQGIGPNLDRLAGQLVSSIVGGSALVSVRDRRSLELVRALGHAAGLVHLVADDASFLPGRPRPDLLESRELSRNAFVAATFSEYSGLVDPEDFVAELATLLAEVIKKTGLPVLLVPHQGRNGSGTDRTDGDVRLHVRLAEIVGPRVSVLPVLPAADTVWLTGQAAMVVSNRYHPIVFAAAAGVPCVGIAVDEYTHQKISGAYALAGLADWCVPAIGLSSGLVRAATDECWERRAEIADHLRSQSASARDALARHWDAVAEIVRGESRGGPAGGAIMASEPESLTAHGDWREAARQITRWSNQLARRDAARGRELTQARSTIAGHDAAIRDAEARSAVAADRVARLEEIVESERSAAGAARDLAGESLIQIAELTREKSRHRSNADEVDRRVTALNRQVAALRAQVATLNQELAHALQKEANAVLRQSLLSERVADQQWQVEEQQRQISSLTTDVAELAALRGTKLLRWSAGPRRIYSWILRTGR